MRGLRVLRAAGCAVLATAALVRPGPAQPANAAADPADEPRRQVLHEAAKAVEAVNDARYDRLKATVLRAIGKAQEKVGDSEGAKASQARADALGGRPRERGQPQPAQLLLQAANLRRAGESKAALPLLNAAVQSVVNARKAPANPDTTLGDAERVDRLIDIAEEQAEAGDADAGRRTLVKAAVLAHALPSNPSPAVRGYQESKADLFLRIAQAQQNLDDPKSARFSLNQAHGAAGAIRDPLRGFKTFAKLVGLQVDRGERDEALATYKYAAELAPALKNDAESANARQYLILMAMRLGKFDDAFRLLEQQGPRFNIKAANLEMMIRAVETGARDDSHSSPRHELFDLNLDRTTARTVMKRAAAAARTLEPVAAQVSALTHVAQVQASLHDDEEALRTLEPIAGLPGQEAAANDARAQVQSAIARVRTADGDRNGARKSWSEAVRLAQLLSGAPQSRRRNYMPPPPALCRNDSLSAIARDQLASDETNEAMKTISLISDDALKANLWMPIAERRIRAGDGKGAEQIVALHGPHFPKLLLLERLAQAELERGRQDDGQRHLREALELVQTLLRADPIDTSVPPWPVGGGLGGGIAGYPHVSDDEWRRQQPAVLRLHAAKLQVQLGESAKAKQTIESIDERFRKEARSEVLETQARHGDEKGALAWALEQNNPADRLAAIQTVANAITYRKALEQFRPAGRNQ